MQTAKASRSFPRCPSPGTERKTLGRRGDGSAEVMLQEYLILTPMYTFMSVGVSATCVDMSEETGDSARPVDLESQVVVSS